MKFKISRSQWEETGRKAGWIKNIPSLSNKFVEKLVSFPESNMGSTTVKLDLNNGQKINKVVVDQEGTILYVGSKRIDCSEDLGFKTSDIVNVSSDQ